MYLVYLDEHGKDAPVARIDLTEKATFKLSFPRVPSAAYTLVNTTEILSAPFLKACWVAQMGISYEVDLPPFFVLPMEHGRQVSCGSQLTILPGRLTIDVSDLKPSGRKVPEPSPTKSGVLKRLFWG